MRYTDDLRSWSEHLNQLFPARGVLVAGSGIGSIVETLERWGVSTVILVEADRDQIGRMNAIHTIPEHWHVHEELLWDTSIRLPFHRLSNPSLNGVVSADGLSKFWKNVTTLETEIRTTTTLDQILGSSAGDAPINWLIIDCIPSLSILRGGEHFLEGCDVVMARSFIKKDALAQAGLNRDELDNWMRDMGFRVVTVIQDDLPQVGTVIYTRDWRSLHITEKDRLLETRDERDKNERLIAELLSQMEQMQKKYEDQSDLLRRSKYQADELRQALEAIKYESGPGQQETRQGDLGNVSKLLTRHLSDQKRQMDEVLEKIRAFEDERKVELGYLEERLQKNILKASGNTIKQIESFHSLQDYLIHDMRPLDFHGWPVSPDIALYLIQKIEENDYGLIVEFGSGTSTLLLAKVIKGRSVKLSEEDITKLVTFEHDKKYYEQTSLALKNQSLAEYVELVHAPLKTYRYRDDAFMYYSCEQRLQELSKSIQRTQKDILVLVDGPPGATGPLARFPALPNLLSQFSGARMDLVLDDANRDEERAIIKLWEQILDTAGLSYSSETISSEKGMYICEIDLGPSGVMDVDG